MNRVVLYLMAGLIFGTVCLAQEAVPAAPVQADPAEKALAALSAGNIELAEQTLAEIKDPAAGLYVKASVLRAKGEPKEAVQTVAQIIALHSTDAEWMPRSELMCAELYFELDMLDAADVTARQVQHLYVGTEVAEQAGALRSKIEKLKQETEG